MSSDNFNENSDNTDTTAILNNPVKESKLSVNKINTNSNHVTNIVYSLMYIFLAIVLVSVMKANFDFIFKLIYKNNLLEKYKKRSESIKTLIKNVSTFIIYISLFGILLKVWDIDVKPLLAGLGIVGLSLGIGAQTYLKNIISGIMILLDDYYHINDTIEVSGIIGRVKDINLQTTILENEKGEVIVIPNGQINIVRIMTESNVSN